MENKNNTKNKTNGDLPPIFGVSEIGKMLGWDKEKVHVYYSRGKLPEPSTYANSRPFWTYDKIENWALSEYNIDINKTYAKSLVHESKRNYL